MVGSAYQEKFTPFVYPQPGTTMTFVGVSRDEFEALKREVEEMKQLLLAAKRIDEITGQPDCETDDKVELLKRVAEAVGVDLEDVFGS
jgi:hypothetical protein